MLASLLTPATTRVATFEDVWQNLASRLTLLEIPPAPIEMHAAHQPPLEEPLRYSLERLFDKERIKSSPVELQPYRGGESYPGFIRRQQTHPAPLAVIEPANEREIVALIRWAGQRDIHLLPWGTGTAPYQGKKQTQEPFMVVKSKRINRILNLDKEQLSVRVQAGATWAEIERELTPQGLSTGVDFPWATRTIGGTVATNAINTKSLGYGTLACNLLHIKAITPAGPVTVAYPQSGKQDQRSLVLGANGRGGFITEVTLRIYPQPAERVQLRAHFAHRELALSALQKIVQSELRPISAQLVDTAALELFEVNSNHKYLPFTHHLRPAPGTSTSQLRILLTGRTGKSLDKRARELRELLGITASQVKEKRGLPQLSQGICTAQPQLCQQLWRHNVLAYTLFATVAWRNLAGFLVDWEDALTSVLQSQSARSGTLLTMVHAAKDCALVETLLLANQLESDEATKARGLAHIQSTAQATRQRWRAVSTSALATRALAAAGQVLDPAGIILF
ncbi:MAG TPA: FAD-binding oxidoreductase [Thermoflexia bacterium]|nr:FAD-binding oxidoreductase [Thermoflexia bacterium]